MMRNTRTNLVLAVLLLVVIGAAYGFWYNTVMQARAKSGLIETEIQTRTADAARVAAAKKTLASLSSDEANINQYFVHPEDIVPFLEGLQNAGTLLGSKVTVASVSNDPSGAHGRIILSLQITGSFDAVLRTLGTFEYGPYDSSIQNLTLDTDGTSGSGWVASTVLSVGTADASSTPAASTTANK